MNDNRHDDFKDKVNDAIAAGKTGRSEILARLAGLPLEELARVPPSTIALLGPGGLAALASARGDLPVGLASAERRMPEPPGPPANAGSHAARKNKVNILAGVFALLVLASGPVFDAFRPIVGRMMDIGWRPVDASTWPRCARLDAYVDGCLYQVGGVSTTLNGIAGHLDMKAERLARFNRHLPADVRSLLPRGVKIVVWRGELELGGPRR